MNTRSLKVISSKINNEEIENALDNLLSSTILCSIGSVNPDSSPHINTCYFAAGHNYLIYILTPPSTKHSSNFLINNHFALNIFRNNQIFGEQIAGVQLFGSVRPLNIAGSLVAFRVYQTKFKIFSEWFPNISMMDSKLESRFFELKVKKGKLIDEGKFGGEVYVEFEIIEN